MPETDSNDHENQAQSPSVEDENLFKTIGSIKRIKVAKVKPLLPKWMKQADNFSGDMQINSSKLSQFEHLFHECLIENLKRNGIKKLFPVQKEVIPILVQNLKQIPYRRPNDVCVLSPTGSGKTYAYCIPIINHLINRIVTQIRALIILPVSDLATQVYQVFQSLCHNTTLRVGLAISSTNNNNNNNHGNFYKLNSDQTKYLCTIDILIATPGKLIDLIQNGNGFTLKSLEILVIDEADRMMNETQSPWFKSIEHSVYGTNAKHSCPCLVQSPNSFDNRHNVDQHCACSMFEFNLSTTRSLFKILFSATLTTDPEKMDTLSLFNPKLMNMNCNHDEYDGAMDISMLEPRSTIPDCLKELMIISDQDRKPLILWHLIKNLKFKRILCFTNSIFSAHRLCQLMQHLPDLVAQELNSKQNLKKRTNVLKKFQDGSLDLLISTDLTARGMDIDGIDCVVCYDPPRNETAYIHRIGRTARAGKQGTAITLISPDQLKHFNVILRRSHGKLNDSNKHVERLNIKNSDLKQLLPAYRQALDKSRKSVMQK